MAAKLGTLALAIALIANNCYADIYMHNPRGSNDRNCERNVNRQNGNRLFDSQNNAKGGYACPRAVGGPERITKQFYYAENSYLPIEWTAQHGCGPNAKEHCHVVIQYACEDTLDPDGKFRSGANVGTPRDGTPRDSDDAATDTIPATEEAAVANTVETRRFGMHESIDYYNQCKARSRNRGLYTADQNVRRNDARGTRQNPNGNRNGLECPEERDHYPYWHPTPWIDVAILVDDSYADERTWLQWCTYFTRESQNVKPKGQCTAAAADDEANKLKGQGKWYNNPAQCQAANYTWEELYFGRWKTVAEMPPALQKSLTAPDCQQAPFSRVNHLGNADRTIYDTRADPRVQTVIPHGSANTDRYVWKVPEHLNENCVLRVRYNISTGDYPAWSNISSDPTGTPGFNASYNGEASPLKQDPYIQVGTEDVDFLSLAVNTNQYGRTFQDRSYAFAIKEDPRTAAEKAAGKVVVNLNVRGKRGNIVQTYPSVEYDFVPNNVNLNEGDIVHFQWTGSDYNPRRGCNNGEGGPPDPNTAEGAKDNARADRSNIVEVDMMDDNFPMNIMPGSQSKSMFVTDSGAVDSDMVLKMAMLGQQTDLANRAARCLTREELDAIKNKNQRENHPQNCAKLNAAITPYFDAGPVRMKSSGEFFYFCSRNNNFSNRDQTGRICVGTGCATATIPTSTSRNIDFGQQIADDRISRTAASLVRETFAFNEKDNDALGDGEAEDCEEMRYNTMTNLSSGEVAGLAVGMVALGMLLAVVASFVSKRYFGGDIAAKCVPGKDDTSAQYKKPLRKAEAPAAARATVDSWSGVRGSRTSTLAGATGSSPSAAADAGAVPPPPPRRR